MVREGLAGETQPLATRLQGLRLWAGATREEGRPGLRTAVAADGAGAAVGTIRGGFRAVDTVALRDRTADDRLHLPVLHVSQGLAVQGQLLGLPLHWMLL